MHILIETPLISRQLKCIKKTSYTQWLKLSTDHNLELRILMIVMAFFPNRILPCICMEFLVLQLRKNGLIQ